MLLTKELEIKWNTVNRKYYESKGYIFTKYGDAFICKIDDCLRGTKNQVECSCDYCGKKFQKMFYHYDDNKEYVNKDACSDCKRKKLTEIKRIKNKIIYTQKIKEICDDMDYELQDFEYIGENTKIPYICNKHKIFGVQISPYTSLSQGHGCYYCGREKSIESWKFTYEDVKNYIESNGKNKLLSKTYIRCKDLNLEITCEECGKPYITSFDYYKRAGKTKCNDCTCSYGERLILQYLTSKNISYEHDTHQIFTSEWDNPLRFDFYLDDYNTAIEFDGEQHYFPVNFDNYHEERFKKEFYDLKIRDQIKNKYCLENRITLIRIPYWNRDNIKEILDNYFNNGDLTYVINQENQSTDSLLLCSNE